MMLHNATLELNCVPLARYVSSSVILSEMCISLKFNLNNYSLVRRANHYRANFDNVFIVEVVMNSLHVHLVPLTLGIELFQVKKDRI